MCLTRSVPPSARHRGRSDGRSAFRLSHAVLANMFSAFASCWASRGRGPRSHRRPIAPFLNKPVHGSSSTCRTGIRDLSNPLPHPQSSYGPAGSREYRQPARCSAFSSLSREPHTTMTLSGQASSSSSKRLSSRRLTETKSLGRRNSPRHQARVATFDAAHPWPAEGHSAPAQHQ